MQCLALMDVDFVLFGFVYCVLCSGDCICVCVFF